MSVLQFPTKPEAELIIACSCGCTTFRIVSTARQFECSVCGNRLVDDVSTIPYDAIRTAEKPVEHRSTHDHGTANFAFHATLRNASVEDTAAVAICNRDGMVYGWVGDGVIDDGAGRMWLKTRLKHIKDLWLK